MVYDEKTAQAAQWMASAAGRSPTRYRLRLSVSDNSYRAGAKSG